MIWHYNIFINGYIFVFIIYVVNIFIAYQTDFRQIILRDDVGIVPYDYFRQQFFSVLCTYRNKICSRC